MQSIPVIQRARNRKRWTKKQREQSRKFWEKKNARLERQASSREAREAREASRRGGLDAAALLTSQEAALPPAGAGSPRATARQSYVFGQYGAADRERRQRDTTGERHESEHDIGFEALNRGSGLARSENSKLENRASSYLEVKGLHRAHVGTGTGRSNTGAHQSGFTSQHYRDTQRALLRTNDPGAVSAAKQINQLAYAHDVPGFREGSAPESSRADLELADRSHAEMARNVTSVSYADSPGTEQTIALGPRERAEIELSRRAARTGRWPTIEEQDEALRRHTERR